MTAIVSPIQLVSRPPNARERHGLWGCADYGYIQDRGNPTNATLRVVTSRRPWRGDTSRWLHPLSTRSFLENDLGLQPLLLRRGPLHALPLAAATAAQLLKGYSLGINAHVITARRSREVPFGEDALEAVARGLAVQLSELERYRAHHLLGGQLLRQLRKVAPGARSPTLSLVWAAPYASPQPKPSTEQRLLLQLYGARQWSICPGPCQRLMLRRGDALYMPPGTEHVALPGPALSAHLLLRFQPLTLRELMLAAGASGFAGPAAFRPLPLWNPQPPLAELCLQLSWQRGHACQEDRLRIALQRLVLGAAPRPKGPPTPKAAIVSAVPAPAPEAEMVKQEPAGRQRRRRELLFLAMLWPVLILVTILAFLCCSAGGGNVRFEDAAAKKRQ
ncbi:unnamed protein product [Effrenium voratum]|nr:unnamed protein product [Effrenium voratum]